jgi:hypothetical protein
MVATKPKAKTQSSSKSVGTKTIVKSKTDKKIVKKAKHAVKKGVKPKAMKVAKVPKVKKVKKEEQPEVNKPIGSWKVEDYLLEALSTLTNGKKWVPYVKVMKFMETYTPYALAANPVVQLDTTLKRYVKQQVLRFRKGGRFWGVTKKGEAWKHEKPAKLTARK